MNPGDFEQHATLALLDMIECTAREARGESVDVLTIARLQTVADALRTTDGRETFRAGCIANGLPITERIRWADAVAELFVITFGGGRPMSESNLDEALRSLEGCIRDASGPNVDAEDFNDAACEASRSLRVVRNFIRHPEHYNPSDRTAEVRERVQRIIRNARDTFGNYLHFGPEFRA